MTGCGDSTTVLRGHVGEVTSLPPVRYAIYRDVVPVFTPSPANLAGRTPFRTFRDVGLAEGATYFYIVRALDRLGNEDGHFVTLPATTSTLSFEDLGPLATSYNVYEGTVSGWYTYLSKACNQTPPPSGGRLAVTVTPAAGNRYYLVTASKPCGEGTSGYASSGIERSDALSTCPP